MIYIDKEQLLEQVAKYAPDSYGIVANVVNRMPTIKAEPIKHGQWVKLYHDNYKCSECGSWWGSDYNDEIINDFNYCPNCGAKMDGGEK